MHDDPGRGSTTSAQARGPTRVGRYLLFDPIASGGMATVHFGRLLGTSGFSRVVAIKRLHAHLTDDPSFVSMLLDEARLVARVRHPNVVTMLDVAELPGELCLVMEYVDGESLASLVKQELARGGRVPVAVACATMVGALMGLHAAHEATSEAEIPLGIVHRDVSPQNIMVGRDGLARVLDFGIAFAAERIQVTREGQIKGKLAYMSPEQVVGEKVDRRTDVYAAGVVLWEAMTGRKLFAGENTAHTMKLITDGAPAPPSTVVASIPRELDAVVLRALARDPGARYATASELAVAIEHAIDIATQQECGAWVAELAAESLAQRARQVAAIEKYVDDSEQRPRVAAEPVASLRPVAPTIPHGSSHVTEIATGDGLSPVPQAGHPVTPRRWPWIAGALGLLIGGGAIAAVISSGPGPNLARAGIQVPDLALYATEPSSPAIPSTLPPALSASAPGGGAKRRPPAGAGTPPPQPRSCNPPWTVDQDGVRVPKKECF